MIASAVQEWTPERSRLNYTRSLETFDWRWRFKTLTEALETHSSKLDAELERLRNVICSAQPSAMIRE